MSKSGLAKEVHLYKGIVVDRALFYYRMLNPAHHRWMGLDDFISEGLTFVIESLPKYDPKKHTQVQTFVYVIVSNYYKSMLFAGSCKKRRAVVIGIDDAEDQAATIRMQTEGSIYSRIDAHTKVTELHRDASRELIHFLNRNFFNPRNNGRVSVRGVQFAILKAEFQELAERYGVTLQDYRSCISAHHMLRRSHVEG